MSILSEARQDVADALVAQGLSAYAKDVKSPKADIIVVEPGSPYVEAGETFKTNQVRFDLAVIGKPLTVTSCYDDLDTLIGDVVLALWDLVDVESISQPGILNWGNKAHVAATVTVVGTINFNEGGA